MERLAYRFEEMHDGTYQVRLNGEFVCYTIFKEPKYIDHLLKEDGFDSREDYLEYRLKQYLK
ncbi:hypothetical protein AAHH67_15935 [Niallia circulans]